MISAFHRQLFINKDHLCRSLSSVTFTVSKFAPGDEVSISRTITNQDVDSFSILSGDFNPVHKSNSQEPAIVHGALLNAIVSSVIGTKLPGPGSLVVEEMLNFPNKCYVGETVTITVKLMENRKIMKVHFSCDVKERNKTVLYGIAKIIMSK